MRNLIIAIAAIILSFSAFSTKANAQVCVDMLDYFNPLTQGNANLISNGERFYNVQTSVMGMPGFYIVKNTTGEVYEEFTYDDQYIYHLRDTSWATENGNVQCEGFDAGFTMVAGNVNPSTVDLTNYPPAKWIKRQMCEGETMNSDHTIVGFKKDGLTCSQCEAPFTGHTGFAMRFNKYHPTYYVGGSLGTVDDVVEVQITEGNGKGETFLYAKKYGWIGFGRSSNITNTVTATAPKTNNVKVCSLIKGGYSSVGLCEGPIDIDSSFYRGQVIGHQDPSPDGKGPWTLYASATDEKEDDSDIVSAVAAKQLIVTPVAFWSTDFSTMTQKYIGSLSPTSEDFADTKVESLFKMDSLISRSPPIYLTSHIPGFVHTGGLGIPAQPEKKDPSETYSAFQARAYPSQDGIKPGTKSTIDNLSFNQTFVGCLQAAVCDPRLDDCLKNDKSGDRCTVNDPPENCIGIGEKIYFSMSDESKIEFLEPADRQAMDKVLWDFSAAVVRKPGDSIPPQRSAILATSLEDYYAQEQSQLAKQNDPNTQSFIADVVPNNLPETSNKDIGSNYKVENINPLSPQKANAAGTPPYEENQPYCQGAHILIENKTEQNQYSVKIWNGQPDCPQPVDWGYYVEYWVGSETSGYQQVSTCGSPSGGNIHKSYGLPIYQEGTADEREWGVPVETLPGCSIPVTPRELAENKLELKVHFQITNSSAPATDNPACTQRPFCTCPNEGACGVVDEGPAPDYDCTKCETWAPSGECATMEAEDLLEVTNNSDCKLGFCQVTDQAFRLTGKVIETPTPDGSPISVTVKDMFSGIVDFFTGLYSSGAKLFNYHCEKSTDCISRHPISQQCLQEKDNWQCTFGERQYMLYGYVPSKFEGKLNEHRTKDDFQVFQAFYKIPGISESYFDPKPSKHELELELSINGIEGNKDASCGTNFLSTTLGKIFNLGGPDSCIDLSIGGSNTRSMYIEYTDHYSQAAQYCLSEAAGSLPTQFPTRALDFCEPFMTDLRSGNNFIGRSAPSGSNLTSGTLNQIEQDSLTLGVPARLLATILEIEGGNANSCFRPTNASDTGTGPYQITDDLALELTTPEEALQWNIKRWPEGTQQSVYREDGRCDFSIANQLAARALKQKAGIPQSESISETDFTKIRDALNGYYGQYNGYCGPTSDTENRWGKDISYCDYGLWRMGLTQYCPTATNGPTPSCDNVFDEIVLKTSTEEAIKKSIFEPTPKDLNPKEIQSQLASDLETLLNKYSKEGNITMETPIEQTPKGFQEELKNLEKYYREKYAQ